jgi:hypothetical protein
MGQAGLGLVMLGAGGARPAPKLHGPRITKLHTTLGLQFSQKLLDLYFCEKVAQYNVLS